MGNIHIDRSLRPLTRRDFFRRAAGVVLAGTAFSSNLRPLGGRACAAEDPSVEGASKEKLPQEVLELVEKQRAFAYQNTHEPASELEQLVVDQMRRVGTAAGIAEEELENALVANYNTFINAVTDNWVYSVDIGGNQVLRPVCNLLTIIDLLEEQVDPESLEVDTDRLASNAREVAAALGCDNRVLTHVTFKKEVIVANRCGEVDPDFYEGRNYVCLSEENNMRYFEMIFSTHDGTLRVGTNYQSDDWVRLKELFLANLELSRENVIPASDVPGDNFACGTFYSPAEERFPTNALSFGGQDFLTILIAGRENPWQPGGFDLSNFNFVDLRAFYESDDYKNSRFHWWNLRGAVGGVRGNWNPYTQDWDRPGISIFHHSLASYGLDGPPPTKTEPHTMSDGRVYNLPVATGRYLESRFYSDYERCLVSFFFGHSGPIDGALQINPVTGIWVRPGDSRYPLGSGSARHMFFYGCSTAGAFKEAEQGSEFLTLFHEWLPARYVDGLRTVCGNDGGAVGGGQDGYEFCCRYNKGESISMSYFTGLRQSSSDNDPVIVAYGENPFDAVRTLTDGRFSKEPVVGPTWAVASAWREIHLDDGGFDGALVAASHCCAWDDINAPFDGLKPANSADKSIPRMTWFGRQGTEEWIGRRFDEIRDISSMSVYWFDDIGIGGGCAVPASWRAEWWDGNAWRPVRTNEMPGVAKDCYNTLRFETVRTDRLRLVVQLQRDVSAGVLEWQVE